MGDHMLEGKQGSGMGRVLACEAAPPAGCFLPPSRGWDKMASDPRQP